MNLKPEMLIGLPVIEKGVVLGTCTGAYEEGHQRIIVIDDDYEIPVQAWAAVLDLATKTYESVCVVSQ